MARRAKTPKYEEFDSFPNTYVFYEDTECHQYFTDSKPLTLELGCGKAEPSMEFAKKYPDKNFIGVDIKGDRLWRPAKNALAEGLENVVFLKMHMRFLDKAFRENSVDEIWLTFSDPFPKDRQAKHRLTHPKFLEMYKKILKPGGTIHFKTDDSNLFQWSLENFVEDEDMNLGLVSFDLHEDDNAPEDAKVKTFYEAKFLKQGKKIKYCQLSL